MDEFTIPIPEFEPWTKYPSLTRERLAIVAGIISEVRHEAVLSHQPGKGDTNWGLGTRVYERTCFKFEETAPLYPEWLIILPEIKGLQFSFAIGTVPFRFYRGKPDELPDRYNIQTFGEIHHIQMCLEFNGPRPPDYILRLAIETHPTTLEVSRISVVEVDDDGKPLGVYAIPLAQPQAVAKPTVVPMHAPPVELAPPPLEPLTKIEEVAESETHETGEEQVAKADTRSK